MTTMYSVAVPKEVRHMGIKHDWSGPDLAGGGPGAQP